MAERTEAHTRGLTIGAVHSIAQSVLCGVCPKCYTLQMSTPAGTLECLDCGYTIKREDLARALKWAGAQWIKGRAECDPPIPQNVELLEQWLKSNPLST